VTGRRGFTLFELLVALTLTGIVALLVYGAAGTAIDTEQRLRTRESEGRAERAWRAILEDALRNTRSAEDYERPTFVVESGAPGIGVPRDRLRFVTAGGTPPLTPDADWDVVVEPIDGRLTLTATPIGVNVPARRILGPPGIAGIDVRVLSGTGDEGWVEEWGFRFLPRVVSLTYWGEAGPIGAPVRLTLPLGVAP
jgi:prepilin-type N-terminal cleavage/methylation domain-containing protein